MMKSEFATARTIAGASIAFGGPVRVRLLP